MSCARVAAAAKRASLAAKASMLRKQQALQHEELSLQQRKQQLALETVSDVASFVEEKARILTHPIFGDISSEPKGKGGFDTRKSTSRRVSSFAADAHNPDRTGEGISEEIPVPRFSRNRLSCPLCKSPHWLSQCNDFRTKDVSERYEFVREKELCYNCLVPGHYAVVCPKTSFCKVDGCHDKHSTFLHPPSPPIDDAIQPETGAQSAYVSVGKLDYQLYQSK